MTALVHNLDQYALSIPDPSGLHHRAKRFRRAAVAADHLPAIFLGHAQLEHDRLLVFLVFADLHLVGPVDQRPGQKLEELLQPIPFAFRSRFTVLLG